jgi:bacteriorhodopsin
LENNPKKYFKMQVWLSLGGGGLPDKNIRLLWWGVLGILLIVAFAKFLLPVRNPVTIEQAADNREIVVYITGAVDKSWLAAPAS